LLKSCPRVLFPMIVLLILAGCTAHRAGIINADLAGKPAKFEVGNVSNLTGETFDVDVCQMYREALQIALNDANLLSVGGDGEAVILNTSIIEYKKGSAFKRWVMPGWGTTVFAVRVDLKDVTGTKDLGYVEARRTVGFGGLLTVEAWKTIVTNIARDVVKELQAKIGNTPV